MYNINSYLSSRVLRILASQNRFQLLCNDIFNIDRVVIPFSLEFSPHFKIIDLPL